jgi:hypothetical protein
MYLFTENLCKSLVFLKLGISEEVPSRQVEEKMKDKKRRKTNHLKLF